MWNLRCSSTALNISNIVKPLSEPYIPYSCSIFSFLDRREKKFLLTIEISVLSKWLFGIWSWHQLCLVSSEFSVVMSWKMETMPDDILNKEHNILQIFEKEGYYHNRKTNSTTLSRVLRYCFILNNYLFTYLKSSARTFHI